MRRYASDLNAEILFESLSNSRLDRQPAHLAHRRRATLRRLRESHGLSGIAVTGYGMEEDLRNSREAGFVDHLVKPITFQRLAAAIERFFAERPPARSEPS